jgi:transcriptional regulator with XRE-family HTH domain
MTPDEIDDAVRAIMWDLRLERQKQGLTQREFCERYGTSQGNLAALEFAKNTPRISAAIRYADVLDCELVVMAIKRSRKVNDASS